MSRKYNYNENDYVKFWLEDNILINVYKSSLRHIDLNIAKQIVALRYKVTEGKPYPIIIDTMNTVFITSEARKYFAGTHSTFNVLAGALIVRSPIARLGAKIFLTIKQKEPVPTRIFADFDTAKEWILPYRAEGIHH